MGKTKKLLTPAEKSRYGYFINQQRTELEYNIILERLKEFESNYDENKDKYLKIILEAQLKQLKKSMNRESYKLYIKHKKEIMECKRETSIRGTIIKNKKYKSFMEVYYNENK